MCLGEEGIVFSFKNSEHMDEFHPLPAPITVRHITVPYSASKRIGRSEYHDCIITKLAVANGPESRDEINQFHQTLIHKPYSPH